MITGFNTDIEFGGVTYHVQTEDKGLSKPVIISLVYDRGTILASKRSSYDDLVLSGFDEKVLGERLQKQHRLICAAVCAGRLDELKKMSMRDQAPPKTSSVPSISGIVSSAQIAGMAERPIPRPAKQGSHLSNSVSRPDVPLVEAFAIAEENFILPAEAIQIVPEKSAGDPRANGKLSLEVLGDVAFKAGDQRSVGFMVCRGRDRKVVRNAEIIVKILGSSFRPQIFHVRTNANGIARIDVQLPTFNSGRAAILVRAISDGEEIELRRPIAHV